MRTILAMVIEIILTICLIMFARICMPEGEPYIFFFFKKRCILYYELFVGISFLIGVLSTAMFFVIANGDAIERLKAYEKRNKELQEKLDKKDSEAEALQSKIMTLETAIQKAFEKE